MEATDVTSEFVDNVCRELEIHELNLDDELVKSALDPLENVKMRKVPGGPSPEMVTIAMKNIKEFIKKERESKF